MISLCPFELISNHAFWKLHASWQQENSNGSPPLKSHNPLKVIDKKGGRQLFPMACLTKVQMYVMGGTRINKVSSAMEMALERTRKLGHLATSGGSKYNK